MTIRANKFTPEVLLSAPRRSPATPNSSGTLALFAVSTYSFQTHEKTAELRILDIETGQSKVVVNDTRAKDAVWLGDGNRIIWLQGGDQGITKLLSTDVGLADAECVYQMAYDIDWLLISPESKPLQPSTAK